MGQEARKRVLELRCPVTVPRAIGSLSRMNDDGANIILIRTGAPTNGPSRPRRGAPHDQARRITVLGSQRRAIHLIGDEHVGGHAIERKVLDVGFALGPLEPQV